MVEIKFVFTDAQIAKAQAVFHLAKPTTVRAVGFFDTPDCQLLRGISRDLKLILRARFSPGKKHGKTTLKIRTSGKLDDSLQTDEAAGAKREFDFAYGRALLDSYSLDHEQDSEELAKTLLGQRSLKRIFSDRQQRLIKQTVGKTISWSDLRIFGPVSPVQGWEELSIRGFEWPVTFELWPLPGSEFHLARQILELSMRTELDQQITAVDRLLVLLKRSGLRPAATETKTQTVLDHFSPGRLANVPSFTRVAVGAQFKVPSSKLKVQGLEL
jgi:hypothetical protein